MPTKELFKPILAIVFVFLLLSNMSCSKDKGIRDKPYEKGGIKEGENRILEGQTESVSDYKTREERKDVLTTITPENSPPQIKSVKLMPEVFKPGDTFYLEVVYSDPDGDEVTISYEWYKNGELVSTEKHLNSPLKRGDKLVIKIKPFDGKEYGKIATLHREILNLPPLITDHKDYHFKKDTFSYQVKATDPDGDTLTYALKEAPSGMTINPTTGLINWNIPPMFKGDASVTVSVTDGYGGEASYNFKVTIGFEGSRSQK